VKVIVTGFNPFGSYTANPSQEAVSDLPDNVKFDDNSEGAKVAKLTLPTCCVDAFSALSDEVAATGDELFAVLLCGLADTRERISLERFALNVRDFRMADNNGHQWDEEHIHAEGPDALRCKVDLRQLIEQLNSAGFACEISNHAGTYVCNETYYRSLYSWQNNPNCRGILFVHVPSYESYKPLAPDNNDSRQPREIYTAALQTIAAYLSK
jgi:pyroglutamyl-peptidase